MPNDFAEPEEEGFKISFEGLDENKTNEEFLTWLCNICSV
jgi:hypothetical protein